MSRRATCHLLCLALPFAAPAGVAQDMAQSELALDLLPGEVWWGGAVTLGRQMSFGLAPIEES